MDEPVRFYILYTWFPLHVLERDGKRYAEAFYAETNFKQDLQRYIVYIHILYVHESCTTLILLENCEEVSQE